MKILSLLMITIGCVSILSFNIPPETKHWHGAAKDSWFAHVAVEVPAEGSSNEWLEPVSEEEYQRLP